MPCTNKDDNWYLQLTITLESTETSDPIPLLPTHVYMPALDLWMEVNVRRPVVRIRSLIILKLFEIDIDEVSAVMFSPSNCQYIVTAGSPVAVHTKRATEFSLNV